MSNETDLDWLARNVHVWPAGDHQPWCYVYMAHGGVMKAAGNFLDAVAKPTMITIDQWLARRAELQNKPSWEDAPEWAEWVAQDDDGEWKWLGSNPSKYINGWTANKLSCCKKMGSYGSVIEKGTILGDWRDTIEKRPEKFKPSIEEANRLAQEFKPFTSIEDNQEQEMKQDSGWFERGELPPVGTVCEVLWNEGRMEYLRTKVFGVNEHGQPIHRFDEGPNKFEYQADPLVTILGTRVFRPIRTERDVLIEIIKKTDDTDDKIADAILAAGFSLRGK